MLKRFYPLSYRKYSSLAILGAIAEDWAAWLWDHGYSCGHIMHLIWKMPHIEAILLRRGVRRVRDIGHADLSACDRALTRKFPTRRGQARGLERYLRARGLIKAAPNNTPKAITRRLRAYARYMKEVQGCAEPTIRQNLSVATGLLQHLRIEQHPARLASLTAADLESFIKKISRRCSRRSLRVVAGRLRSFLRFLAVQGQISQGLDCQIDTPRVYREEQLPPTLPWETVQVFLNSIDRSSTAGLRDFAMFLLMATYGLRASDVVALTLDDIHWRTGKISISQRKTGVPIELPLTDSVAAALHSHLEKAPPPPPFRQVFLRLKAPIGTLTTTSVSAAFRIWARRSGVDMPGRGSCHRIRHSYAVFLLRKGTPIKTIGDLLGHRTVESTATYLRLGIEDLRDVALPVPTERKTRKAVRS